MTDERPRTISRRALLRGASAAGAAAGKEDDEQTARERDNGDGLEGIYGHGYEYNYYIYTRHQPDCPCYFDRLCVIEDRQGRHSKSR